jgi:hypothetical protein
MKQGLINLVAFVAFTLGPLAFWHSNVGYDLLEKGYGWLAYVSAPVLGAAFAAVASKGDFKGKTFKWLFLIFSVALLGIGYAVNVEF